MVLNGWMVTAVELVYNLGEVGGGLFCGVSYSAPQDASALNLIRLLAKGCGISIGQMTMKHPIALTT